MDVYDEVDRRELDSSKSETYLFKYKEFDLLLNLLCIFMSYLLVFCFYAVWSSLQKPNFIGADKTVPFLPLNPELSSTRNQVL